MKKAIARAAALGLLALASGCYKQDTTNITAANTSASDDFADDNGFVINSAVDAAPGNLDAPAPASNSN